MKNYDYTEELSNFLIQLSEAQIIEFEKKIKEKISNISTESTLLIYMQTLIKCVKDTNK